MESIWSKETRISEKDSFLGNAKAEVVVIGGGMAGILIAKSLKKYGLDVVVLEANRIGSGQTKNTTAKITSQHGLIYDELIKNVGKEKAERYAIANQKAIVEYQRMIEEENIECNFERLPAYLYSADFSNLKINETDSVGLEEKYSKNHKIEKLEREAFAANSLGIRAKLENDCELPLKVNRILKFEGQAQFNPLKFIDYISKDLIIYENSRVLCVKDHMVYTERGDIMGENIVFATHYPFVNVPGIYFLRQHQEKSYVLALKNAQKLQGMYYGIDRNGLSFRNSEDLLLLGGAGHRTGHNQEVYYKNMCDCHKNIGSYEYLRIKAKEYYPNSEEIANWSAKDCVTHDNIPFIGRYSYLKPYWYVATGFKKWGMTSSMIAAMIISDEIIGNVSPYSEVFTPQRFNLKASCNKIIKDIGISIKGLSKGYFTKKTPKCKHLGCSLKWNTEEKTWECPCHGSTFNEEGKLINGPAQTDLELENKEL